MSDQLANVKSRLEFFLRVVLFEQPIN